jgi:hypothetical protein
MDVRPKRLYPKLSRDYSSLPELVLRVQTAEGEVEERSNVLMQRPLAAGMRVPFRDTKVMIEHVEEIDGSLYWAAASIRLVRTRVSGTAIAHLATSVCQRLIATGWRCRQTGRSRSRRSRAPRRPTCSRPRRGGSRRRR